MIWVIGGTKDSRDFLEKFVKYNDDIIVSTATEYGAKLIENLPVKTSSEKMDKEAMLKFVEDNKITKVVDTSHPYAFEVSKNAMEVAEEKNIEYFRFEREEVDILPKKYKNFEEIKDLIEYVEKLDGNILVTLGSNNVPLFKDLKNLSNIYFRILSRWDMVKRCEHTLMEYESKLNLVKRFMVTKELARKIKAISERIIPAQADKPINKSLIKEIEKLAQEIIDTQ